MVDVLMRWGMMMMVVVMMFIAFSTARAERGSSAIRTVHVKDTLLVFCSLWLLSLLGAYSSHHLAIL